MPILSLDLPLQRVMENYCFIAASKGNIPSGTVCAGVNVNGEFNRLMLQLPNN